MTGCLIITSALRGLDSGGFSSIILGTDHLSYKRASPSSGIKQKKEINCPHLKKKEIKIFLVPVTISERYVISMRSIVAFVAHHRSD